MHLKKKHILNTPKITTLNSSKSRS